MSITRALSIPHNVGAGDTLDDEVVSGSHNLATGDTIIIGVRYETGAATTCTLADVAGNTYTSLGSDSQNDLTTHFFKCENCTGNATNVITASLGANREFRRLFGEVLHATAGYPIQDGSFAISKGSSTAPSAGNVTLTATGALVGILGYYNTANVTGGANVATLVNGGNNGAAATNYHATLEGLSKSATTYAIAATLSGTGPWVMGGLAFKESAGGDTLMGQACL